MQFLSENHMNGCKICGQFGFRTESEPIFGFLHTPALPVIKRRVVSTEASTDLLQAATLKVKQLSQKPEVRKGTAACATDSIESTAVVEVGDGHDIRHDDCATTGHPS